VLRAVGTRDAFDWSLLLDSCAVAPKVESQSAIAVNAARNSVRFVLFMLVIGNDAWKSPNELKLSDRGWRGQAWNSEPAPSPAAVRWSAWLDPLAAGQLAGRLDDGGAQGNLTLRVWIANFDPGRFAVCNRAAEVGLLGDESGRT